MGKATKLIPEIVDPILEALRYGYTVVVACSMGGIHKDTFYDWYNAGKKKEQRKYIPTFPTL